MRAIEIPAYEADFLHTGTTNGSHGYQLKPLSVQIPNSSEYLKVMRCIPNSGDKTFYYEESLPKHRIVIHFTAGYLKGDVETLTRHDYHVSVPFLIGRDGTIYNLFSSSYWSYHLGPGAIGGNEEMSKVALGIELSNIGPLAMKNSSLYTHTGKMYCDQSEIEYYSRQTYRGYHYYATFTKAQYKSLNQLIAYLTAKFNIPKQLLPSGQRDKIVNDIGNFYGICTHANFRDDKFDIGPAFDWSKLNI